MGLIGVHQLLSVFIGGLLFPAYLCTSLRWAMRPAHLGRLRDSMALLALFGVVEMAGILRELGTLPFGGVAGVEGRFQLGGRDGLALSDMHLLVEQPYMGFLDVDGLPAGRHGSDSFAV
jgi:hypothetical protein